MDTFSSCTDKHDSKWLESLTFLIDFRRSMFDLWVWSSKFECRCSVSFLFWFWFTGEPTTKTSCGWANDTWTNHRSIEIWCNIFISISHTYSQSSIFCLHGISDCRSRIIDSGFDWLLVAMTASAIAWLWPCQQPQLAGCGWDKRKLIVLAMMTHHTAQLVRLKANSNHPRNILHTHPHTYGMQFQINKITDC